MTAFITTMAGIPDTSRAPVSRASEPSRAVHSAISNAGAITCPIESDLLHFNTASATLTKAQSRAIHTHLLQCHTCRDRTRLAVDAFEDIMRALTLRLS
jgi:hypothetical protein